MISDEETVGVPGQHLIIQRRVFRTEGAIAHKPTLYLLLLFTQQSYCRASLAAQKLTPCPCATAASSRPIIKSDEDAFNRFHNGMVRESPIRLGGRSGRDECRAGDVFTSSFPFWNTAKLKSIHRGRDAFLLNQSHSAVISDGLEIFSGLSERTCCARMAALVMNRSWILRTNGLRRSVRFDVVGH
jgi:hypothetical protein